MAKKKIVLQTSPAFSKTIEKFKKELNLEQFHVVTHNEGPALVIAGAGSGKTRALTYRVAYLVEKGVAPESIVLVTFTKKAAQEMIERVIKLVGKKSNRCNAGTFHHIANQTLHRYGHTIGLQNNFSIMDESDQKTLMKLSINKLVEKENRKKFPNSAIMGKIYSKQINRALTLKETLKRDFPQWKNHESTIRKVLQEFNEAKRKNNQMDFDDLMLYFLKFLQEDASTNFKKQIKHVLVDEFQDVNAVQARIVESLSENVDSLVVVGDDAQAIFRFRGADFSHMLNFPKNNPGCIEYKLEENYRSTPEILDLANKSITHNKKQFKKNLRTTLASGDKPLQVECDDVEKEARFITQMVEDHHKSGIPYHEQAILFRSAFHSIPLEQKLIENHIPYEVRAGLRFFEKAHIKDLLAFLIIFTNPKDQIQWYRVLGMHAGISDVGAQKILIILPEDKDALVEFVNLDLQKKLKGQRIQKKGISSLTELQGFIRNLLFDISVQPNARLPKKNVPNLSVIVDRIEKYIKPLLKIRYPTDFSERILDFKAVSEFSSSYKSISSFLVDILTQTELIRGSNEGEKKENPLILSTIHQAKGLEWEIVYLMNLTNGRMPSSQIFGEYGEEEDIYALEEERRLFYVAVTRAKKYLYLSQPLYVRQMGNKFIPEGSKFLEEIKTDDVFDEAELEEPKEEILNSWELYLKQQKNK